MRLQATLLAALATLVSVPAVAQPAVPPGPAPDARPAAAPGSSGSPEATGHKKHGATSSDEQATDKNRPSAGGQPAPEAATNNNGAVEAATNDHDGHDNDDSTPDAGTAPELIPPALDTLGGHVSLAASAGLAAPFGDLQQRAPQSDLMGSGAGFGAELGYGVSRSVVVGAWGQALRLGAGSTCAGCRTSSFAFGPFVRYHLVQGVRFDPWISAGIGFRTTTIGGAPGGDLSYSGLEWLRLRIGGDWYAFSKLGFGPFVELDAGHYQNRPAQTSGSAATHLAFSAGLRVIVDLPGK